MEEELNATISEYPFPHLVVENFYNDEELELIWEELKFYTKPNKLLDVKHYGGVEGFTESKAILLDNLYKKYDNINYRNISNILTVNRKLFSCGVLDVFSNIHDCCCLANQSNSDITKVRYYHDGEGYKPHTDRGFNFLAFSYFYKEPKKFSGGELYFPKYDFEFTCDNNSMIIFPGWVEHGVKEVSIKESEYFDGYGRYSITSFFGSKPRSIDRT